QYTDGRTGGTLRNGWAIGQITQKGNSYTIEIINPVEYASYVEYGHRQTPGRFVPAIGKKLKKSWVRGRFMMTLSINEIEMQIPSIVTAKVWEELKRCFDVK
ncbi:HK97 gp10 family phage protein, partial [Clostridium neonatale]